MNPSESAASRCLVCARKLKLRQIVELKASALSLVFKQQKNEISQLNQS